MFGSLANFSQVTVTLPASDVAFGRMVMGASEQPRLILACCAYSGTNTAAASLSLYVIPSQAPATAGEFDLSLGGQDAIKVIQGCTLMDSAVNPQTAQAYIPASVGDSGGRGASPGYLILPPYALLVIAPSVASLNGTVIVSVSSAEMC
jgi:hypothetical protein|tara:strand:- start:297 stop:743 length:447 start_codon:yes stop_codon:yes gene_type:complete